MKLKKFINENWHYLLAFLIPVFIMMLAYITFYIYPFGEGSVLVLDLNGQYVSYFEQFRATFMNGKSLFYSWSSSLGGEFLGTTAYYLLSPFSFITLLLPANHITEAILLMTLFKLGSASVSMTYYLCKHNVPKDKALVLGLCYGLSGYAVVQVMNIMWIDAVIILPIFILAIERLVEKERYGLFTFTLIYLFITNYYIAYMIGLFGGLYFVYYSIRKQVNWRKFVYDFIRFILYTIIAVLICSWLLLPTIYSLSLGKSTFTTPDYSLFVKFDLLDFFMKMLPSTYDSVNVQGLPFVYAGTITIFMIPLYFMNEKINWHEKLCAIVLLVVVMLCMNISWIDLALHGFQNPNWLNYRYAFVYPFMMISLAGEAFAHEEGYSAKQVGYTLLGFILFIAFGQKYGFYYVDDLYTVVLSVVVLTVFAVALIQNKKYRNILLSTILICTCSIELLSNAYTSLHDLDDEVLYSTRTSYIPFMEELKEAYEVIQNEDSSLLYRTEKLYHRTVNDPMSVGYNGISHSTSSLNKESIQLVKRLGYAARDHWTKYLGGTPISDSLLGIKYIMAKNETVPYYSFLYSVDTVNVYRNDNALSIITSVNDDLLEVDMEVLSALELQNAILSAMLGIEYTEFFEPFEVESITLENLYSQEIASHTMYHETDSSLNAEIYFNFNSSNGKHVYYYFPSTYPREVNMWFNNTWVDTYFGNESTRIYDLGPVEDGDNLGMTVINTEVYLRDGVDYFYTFNEELFNESVKKLVSKSAKITEFDETSIKAVVTSDTNDIIYTSIPYAKGWDIYVDGEKVEYYKIMDAFIGFNITEGRHEITMKFTPHGFTLGLGLGLIGIIGFFVLQYFDNKKFRLFIESKIKR
ncbi:MAG: YfhO family protein [Erysipelotrichales bacterium]|nr:YfhO family protein [Erysipelotrichales bacterium]